MSSEAAIQKGKGIVANPEFVLTFFLAAALGIAGAMSILASWMTTDAETHAWSGLPGVVIIAVLGVLMVAARFLGERLFVGLIALMGLLAGIGAVMVVGYLWASPTGDGGHANPLVAGLIALLMLGLPPATIFGERVLPLFVAFLAGVWGVMSVIVFVMVVFIGIE
ncbi:MAG: hypothetical protein AB7S26_31615 [Sandaracinaceae bacterium]